MRNLKNAIKRKLRKQAMFANKPAKSGTGLGAILPAGLLGVGGLIASTGGQAARVARPMVRDSIERGYEYGGPSGGVFNFEDNLNRSHEEAFERATEAMRKLKESLPRIEIPEVQTPGFGD
jgi:hypothetical protein